MKFLLLALSILFSSCGNSPAEQAKNPYHWNVTVELQPDEKLYSFVSNGVVTMLPGSRYRLHHFSYRADGNVYVTAVTDINIEQGERSDG